MSRPKYHKDLQVTKAKTCQQIIRSKECKLDTKETNDKSNPVFDRNIVRMRLNAVKQHSTYTA